MVALERDLVDVPLAARLGHRLDRRDVNDGARAVGRVLALVEDIRLIAGPVGDLGRIRTAHVDAAVRVVAHPEFDPELEVRNNFV